MIASQVPTLGRSGSRPRKRPEYLPGLLVVRIKEDVVANVPDVRGASAARIRSIRLPAAVDEPLRELRRKRQIREVVPIFAVAPAGGTRVVAGARAAAAFATSVRESENEDLRGINLIRLSGTADTERIEKDLAGTSGIEYVHRVPARWPTTAGQPAAFSSDPLVNRQWGLRAIRWFDTEPLPDARNVRVAVLDTGIDRTHPDLQDIASYSFDGAGDTDIVGHGTHVAGIIAANPNNEAGIAGVCRCQLHIWKIFGDQPAADGEYYVDEVMYQRALNAVRNAGMNVVNLSIGGTASSRTEELLFRRLIDAGVTVVAAMGNEFLEGNPKEYPSGYPNVIGVGATNESNRRAPFSNTGDHIALAAPGTNILSTLPLQPSAYRGEEDTEYAAWSGTSMATPHVTAVAALVLAREPGLNPSQVTQRLQNSTTRLRGMGNRSRTQEYGTGLLNLRNAVS